MKLYRKIVGLFFNAEKFCPFTKHEIQSSREKEENKRVLKGRSGGGDTAPMVVFSTKK